jgi:CBS domain containing-hemolysin-like protein
VDPDPGSYPLSLFTPFVPGLVASLASTASATLAHLSSARRAALRETLRPTSGLAIERYLAAPEKLESRWLWLRVFGVSMTAAMSAGGPLNMEPLPQWTLGVATAVAGYALPSAVLRIVAARHPSAWAPRLITLLRPFEWLVVPFADPFAIVSRRWAGVAEAKMTPALAESEVEMVVTEGEQQGALSPDASAMIRNVLEFGDVRAEDVMVPRIHVDSLDAALSLAEATGRVAASQHSRYPVFSDTVDKIVGILHVKDLYARVAAGEGQRTVGEVARRPVAFVPDAQPASIVLRDMRIGRHHLAVVVDEYGGFAGIVTLEDLLEEIVGEIHDEHDSDERAGVQNLGDGRFLVSASIAIADFNRHLSAAVPEGDYVSLGGLLVERFGEIPEVGATTRLAGLEFIIRAADERHIESVEVAPAAGISSTPPPVGDDTTKD